MMNGLTVSTTRYVFTLLQYSFNPIFVFCLLKFFFFWSWVRPSFNNVIANPEPNPKLTAIVLQK
jgi:hypothetical protein